MHRPPRRYIGAIGHRGGFGVDGDDVSILEVRAGRGAGRLTLMQRRCIGAIVPDAGFGAERDDPSVLEGVGHAAGFACVLRRHILTA
jgi:hypothetical protein